MRDPTTGVVKLVLEMIGGLLSTHDKEKEKLFEKHIDPLFQKILLIHADYISGFQEFKRHLDDKSTPLPEVVEFVEERRRESAAHRDLAEKLALELQDAERRFVRADAWAETKLYCEAIIAYLSASMQFTELTWFSGYLDQVKKKIARHAENPWWDPSIHGYPKGESARQDLRTNVEAILNTALPGALSRINEHYAKLRTLLL